MIDRRTSRRDPRRRVASGGFTLIELLISALIFSIILVGYTALFSFSIQSWLASQGRFQRSQNIYGVGDRMMRDIASAMPPVKEYPTTGVQVGAQGVNFEGSTTNAVGPSTITNSIGPTLLYHMAGWSSAEGSMGWDASTLGGENGADLIRNGFWLERSGTTDTIIVAGQTNSKAGGPLMPTDAPSIQDLFATDIAQMKFEYTADGTTWTTTYNARTTGALPKLVRLTLTTIERDVAQTAVFLIRPMANGAYITQ